MHYTGKLKINSMGSAYVPFLKLKWILIYQINCIFPYYRNCKSSKTMDPYLLDMLCVVATCTDYLCNKFKKRSSIHKSKTHTHNSLQIPLFKTAAGQRSFAFRAVHLWNNLDKNLKDCYSLKTFKTALKKHLLVTENS